MLNLFPNKPDSEFNVARFINLGGQVKMVATTRDFLANAEKRRLQLQLQLDDIVSRIKAAVVKRRQLLDTHKELYEAFTGGYLNA